MQSDRLKLFIDPFHDDTMGAAMFDHFHWLLQLAPLPPCLQWMCIMLVQFSNTLFLVHFIGGDWVDDTKLWPQL